MRKHGAFVLPPCSVTIHLVPDISCNSWSDFKQNQPVNIDPKKFTFAENPDIQVQEDLRRRCLGSAERSTEVLPGLLPLAAQSPLHFLLPLTPVYPTSESLDRNGKVDLWSHRTIAASRSVESDPKIRFRYHCRCLIPASFTLQLARAACRLPPLPCPWWVESAWINVALMLFFSWCEMWKSDV